MLVPTFTSPRRLALLVVFAFILALGFLSSSSSYRGYLPEYKIPGYTKTSNEDDQQYGTVERPAEELMAPHAGQETADPVDEHARMSSADYLAVTSTQSSLETSTSELTTHTPTPSVTAPVSGSSIAYTPQPLPQEPPEQIQMRMQGLLHDWHPDPSLPWHWPEADKYVGKDYNPARWEGFEWAYEIYTENGIESLKEDKEVQLEVYHPYPDYQSSEYKKQWQGDVVSCMGPRGRRMNDSVDDLVKAFSLLPESFPAASVGSAEVTGVEADKCFDRYHRYGPYRYGEDDTAVKGWEKPTSSVHWESVGWGRLQDECVMENQDRFGAWARNRVDLAPNNSMPDFSDHPLTHYENSAAPGKPQHMSRTAVVIRAYEGYTYAPNDIIAIRAMIAELSLLSGGEYSVFLFVNVKDNGANLDEEKVRQDFLHTNVPREFHDIAVLWNERIMEAWYPNVTDWQVYWHQFMPLQWFMETHTEFDFVWNWETDARYTGNHYQFLSTIAGFALETPRKYLWERNARYYIPEAHSNYSAFLSDTDFAIETAWREHARTPIWGPQPYNIWRQNPIGPVPPTDQASDNFEWGVGEEADLITLLPIWSPVNTAWEYRDKIWNFIPGVHPVFKGDGDPNFTHEGFATIDRRVYINTLSRFSRRQLRAMHLENLVGRAMQAEMWPATVALHHGLKAVYAPHPIWTDRHWPAWYTDAVFNADGGLPAQWSQQGDSVYSHDREWNFAGWSWYYASKFPKTLYRRWLGWADKEDWSPLKDISGKELEETGRIVDLGEKDENEEAKVERVGGRGRMCLPAMLLHPVKKVVEDEGGDGKGVERPSGK